MAFEFFQKTKHRAKRTDVSFVTIAKDATRICFSYQLTDWLTSKEVKSLDFLFDSEENKIAFSPGKENSYCVQVPQRSQSYVSARVFLKFIGSPLPGRYSAEIDREKNMIVVNLDSRL